MRLPGKSLVSVLMKPVDRWRDKPRVSWPPQGAGAKPAQAGFSFARVPIIAIADHWSDKVSEGWVVVLVVPKQPPRNEIHGTKPQVVMGLLVRYR